MGGKPIALVNSIWSENDLEKHNKILSGMSFACEKFNVPMVGGHSNQKIFHILLYPYQFLDL